MASPLPSLQVRKGSAVNEFLGWLIEIMAEVGTRSSMTSNHGRGHAHHQHARTYLPHTQTSQYVAFSHISLLTSLLLLYIPSYVTISLTPFYTTHAPCPPQQQLPSGNNKTIHNQGVIHGLWSCDMHSYDVVLMNTITVITTISLYEYMKGRAAIVEGLLHVD